jgi:hypothetical protein
MENENEVNQAKTEIEEPLDLEIETETLPENKEYQADSSARLEQLHANDKPLDTDNKDTSTTEKPEDDNVELDIEVDNMAASQYSDFLDRLFVNFFSAAPLSISERGNFAKIWKAIFKKYGFDKLNLSPVLALVVVTVFSFLGRLNNVITVGYSKIKTWWQSRKDKNKGDKTDGNTKM